ncbi:hypothetical protein NM897_15405 [Planococcus maritimus]|uniref:hypothetical protein n=1 Tax=Planococcus maritimus TaxID=192421 RepID=UPI00313A271B
MKPDIKDSIMVLSGIEDDSKLMLAFNYFSDQAPLVGKLLMTYRINKLNKRFNIYQKKLNDLASIVKKIENVEFLEFIYDFLFPALLEDLLSEDEDAKISLFLNGFEHVVKERLIKESEILIYFDRLRELRYVDIEYLISSTWQYKKYAEKEDVNKDYLLNVNSFIKDQDHSEDIVWSIESKLESLGLFDSGRRKGTEEIMAATKIYVDHRNTFSKPPIWPDFSSTTKFGYKFLEFFGLIDRYK